SRRPISAPTSCGPRNCIVYLMDLDYRNYVDSPAKVARVAMTNGVPAVQPALSAVATRAPAAMSILSCADLEVELEVHAQEAAQLVLRSRGGRDDCRARGAGAVGGRI